MRNIISLLYRYNSFLLFLVLEVIAFLFIINFSSYHRSSYFNSSAGVVAWFKNVKHSLNEPFVAIDENKKLRQDNAELFNLQIQNFYPLEARNVLIDDSMYFQQFTYIPAMVIDNSYNRQQNYILINAGTEKGVEKEMGVICSEGLVGFIKDVSAHYAIILPVLNKNFSTSVELKKNHHFGYITWDGDDYRVAQLNDLINTAPVEVGDTIVTRGAMGRFPQGILVGTVKHINKKEGDNHYQIDVELSTDFSNIHTTYTITNYFKTELNSLRENLP